MAIDPPFSASALSGQFLRRIIPYNRRLSFNTFALYFHNSVPSRSMVPYMQLYAAVMVASTGLVSAHISKSR